MVELIVGAKGKGKTKVLLEKAADAIKNANGTVVYVDKNKQHMYELSTKIRLVAVTQYIVKGEDGFLGFISGIIASDHDLEWLILDSFMNMADLEGKDITNAVKKVDELSSRYNINIVISVSLDEKDLPESLKAYKIVAL